MNDTAELDLGLRQGTHDAHRTPLKKKIERERAGDREGARERERDRERERRRE